MTNMSPTTILVEKIIKIVATSGFTMAILRFVTFAIRQHLSKPSKTNKNIQRNIENFWISLLQLIAIDRTKCFSSCKHCNKDVVHDDIQPDEYYKSADHNADGANMTNSEDSDDHEKEDELIEYKGSCHCQSIRFTVSKVHHLK